MLMRLHQETEVAVFTEIRGQENFRRLAVQLPAGINIRDQGVNRQQIFVFCRGGRRQLFYLQQPAVTVSLHTCSMQRSGMIGAISGTSMVSLIVLLGEGNTLFWPLGCGLWKDALKRDALEKEGAAMPGEWARLKGEENDQNTLFWTLLPMNSVTNSKWRHVWMSSSQ